MNLRNNLFAKGQEHQEGNNSQQVMAELQHLLHGRYCYGGYDDPRGGYGGRPEKSPLTSPRQAFPTRQAVGGRGPMSLRKAQLSIAKVDDKTKANQYIFGNLSASLKTYDPFYQGPQAYLGALDVEVGFASAKKFTDVPYDQDELASVFIKWFENQVFAPGQKLLMDHKNIPLSFVVKNGPIVGLEYGENVAPSPTVSAPQARGILRGSGAGGGTGVGDSVVNQLLSKLDGVDQLNNILLIGMTNRMDMIDDALLRPGRLEVHMEISLPDEADVDVAELAHLTKNFSGAEIGGLVKSASSFAFNRHVKVGTVAGVSDDIENMKVNRDDSCMPWMKLNPHLVYLKEELEGAMAAGILPFITNNASSLCSSSWTSGSGKTALAAAMAKSSEFPFIKLVSAENMVGFGDAQKIQYLNKVFMDAYKSPQNIVVIDNIERIIEWVPIGPDFQMRFYKPLWSFLLNNHQINVVC
ncbi:hypothetical protein DID88_000563 [Monilinia fructigena]|uniref:Vesicular-fusion protein SEC18 n=1 Tax=Monilinia fructigena TaxID=38457 RepID=A0A395IHW6_9HELO|nr:hypothetical protein DID88_000563 [Monilinia fructigena]